MIAIDTNVLVRFLVRDDEAQFARASALFERAQRADDAVFLAELVVCELVWVLQRAYRVAKPAIVGTLNELVRARHIELEAADRVVRRRARRLCRLSHSRAGPSGGVRRRGDVRRGSGEGKRVRQSVRSITTASCG